MMNTPHSNTGLNQTSNVRIVSRAFDSWTVEFRIDVSVLLDQQALVEYLRSVKQHISETQSLPQSCLLFDGIIKKTRTEQEVDVVVRIKKKMLEKGAPSIRLIEEAAADGTNFSNMRALLSFKYFDEFERVITHDRLMQSVREARIAPGLVDTDIILNALDQILATQNPRRDIVIAQGRLPECGNNAEVEFFFQTFVRPENADQYYSTRRVHTGDLLCRKTPPTTGQKAGMNVLGETLNPRRGLDVELIPGPNTELSLDGLDAVAAQDGVAVIERVVEKRRTLKGIAEIPKSVRVQVNPVLKIKGDEVVDIETSSAVEIEGNLRVGSRILTDREVFISGNVESGATIDASDDVIVEGTVSGAAITSDRSIVTRDVADSTIHAQDSVIVRGKIQNSTVTGDTVYAQSVAGGRVCANREVTLERIDADEGNVISSICVGMSDFFTKRLEENQKFIEAARANLERIEMVVGEDVIQQALTVSTQTALMKLLTKLRLASGPQSRKQADIFRKLLDAVPPTKAMIVQKERECIEIANKISDKSGAEGLIIVKERVSAKAIVEIDGRQATLAPTEGEVAISNQGGRIMVEKRGDSLT